jgi:hypothetical protein
LKGYRPDEAGLRDLSQRDTNASIVVVPMVQVGIIGMVMDQARMRMQMDMPLAGRVARSGTMLMMIVVRMGVAMRDGFMKMLMIMSRDEVEIEPDRHQYGAGTGRAVCDFPNMKNVSSAPMKGTVEM